jgi:16S rRNA (cytosine967-C5)-methyltransferase
VLVRVFEEGAYADRAFAAEAARLDPRDRAFAQRIAYGAVQRVRTLDHALEAIGGRPLTALDVPVRAALRLGAY